MIWTADTAKALEQTKLQEELERGGGPNFSQVISLAMGGGATPKLKKLSSKRRPPADGPKTGAVAESFGHLGRLDLSLITNPFTENLAAAGAADMAAREGITFVCPALGSEWEPKKPQAIA